LHRKAQSGVVAMLWIRAAVSILQQAVAAARAFATAWLAELKAP